MSKPYETRTQDEQTIIIENVSLSVIYIKKPHNRMTFIKGYLKTCAETVKRPKNCQQSLVMVASRPNNAVSKPRPNKAVST